MCDECGCGDKPTIRKIDIAENILAKNDQLAEDLRVDLAAKKILMLNMLSSPGSGKTTLLEASLPTLMEEVSMAVLEGDVQTRYDAERLRKLNVPAIQINTGGGCHLDALSVKNAIYNYNLMENNLIIIENVGNLVCPAAFDLGEDMKIALISVTEGDDKPEKYPALFAKASLMIITKIDLLPYVDFDIERCIQGARQVNPALKVIQISAKTGEGIDQWNHWLMHVLQHKKGISHHHH